ncbi:hypothetical protein R3W88_033070 [Solanum pinnatisectum]|uniref:Uncharacterized protein n=1 Tax=Solanum pinnatisectum TaxID=50273 RepID=A0AAV9K230_9SOLN|nr:hypothetical protein R3W88_033070 [Solanum pinnatisectum]
MDGGSQEKHTNLQEGVSKRGNLTHVLHEGTHSNHSPDHRASATTKSQKHKTDFQQAKQQKQPEAQHIVSIGNDKEQQKGEEIIRDNLNKVGMAKDKGNKASSSNQDLTSKSKNKPSKKRREAAKKKQSKQQGNEQQQNVPPDKRHSTCQTNTVPVIDEYAIDNSEDEMDMDNQSLKDPDEEEETCDLLIRAFSPHRDKSMEDEIQQVANNQELSPGVFHYDKFHFKNQEINIVTAGRANTRLFTSKSSQ